MNTVNFLAKFTQGEGCWEWTACKINGYGRFGVNGSNRLAHRMSYEHFVGPIPDGLVIDHLCRNKGCVNPEHLEPVDFVENVRRGDAWLPENLAKMIEARKAIPQKTHCPKGHEYAGANLYVCSKGYRACKTCRHAAVRKNRSDKGGPK